jgi:hypothetical protein
VENKVKLTTKELTSNPKNEHVDDHISIVEREKPPNTKKKKIQNFFFNFFKKINIKSQKKYSNMEEKVIISPPQIKEFLFIFGLRQFNTFIKKSNFEFGHCCVCNEKKCMHELIKCGISNLRSNLKHMKNKFEMNSKHHFENEIKSCHMN